MFLQVGHSKKYTYCAKSGAARVPKPYRVSLLNNIALNQCCTPVAIKATRAPGV